MSGENSAIILDIGGMTCSGCANTVTKVLGKVPGVKAAHVELEQAKATVEGDASVASLIEAVEAAGFDAAPAKA